MNSTVRYPIDIEKVCTEVASGSSVSEVLKEAVVIAEFWRFLTDNEEARGKFMQAKAVQGLALGEKLLDASKKILDDPDARPAEKLATLKWLAERLAPQLYATKAPQVQQSGSRELPSVKVTFSNHPRPEIAVNPIRKRLAQIAESGG